MTVRLDAMVNPAMAPAGDPAPALAVSILVAVTEENPRSESLDEIYLEFSRPFRNAGIRYEFIFIFPPWIGPLIDPVKALVDQGEPIRVMQAGQTLDEADMLRSAAANCDAPIVITLPPYRRVEAPALLNLFEAVQNGTDMVVARRWPRRDSWLSVLQNRVFHRLLAGVTGDPFHDVACGVRAMRTDVLLALPVNVEQIRFIPLIARRQGYTVHEIQTPQHPWNKSPNLYSPGIYLRRLIDLLGLIFLLRFKEKPLRFFGMVGSGVGLTGATILAVLLVQRLGGQAIGNRPMLLLGVLLLVLGFQAIALGLVCEIIVHFQAPAGRGRLFRPRRDSNPAS